MEMFSRLKTTVGGLIGNPVVSQYDITPGQVGSGGLACLWKIYHGVKRSTKQEAAIFVFEKKLLERFYKKDREAVLEVLKRGPAQLTRLRHPCLLTVQTPMEESRDSLAFATEPVFASLANVLGRHDNLSPVPDSIKGHDLYEVEIKYGLLQVTEGLKFLHNDVHMIHGNLAPENIILNINGAWKLAGFDFCSQSITPQDQAPTFPMREWDPDFPATAQPRLEYLAPEYALTMSCETASDMFSLGMLMYAVMNRGKTLFDCNESLQTFKRNSQQLKCLNISLLGSLSDGLKEYVKMLLNATPTVRPDADQISKIPFFEDVGSMTLQYLDSLFQRDNLAKSQFFKGLPKVLSNLPKRVVHQRVLPCLSKELVNRDMIPFVLPNLLHIADSCTDQEYVKLVLPELKPVFKVQEPVQVMLIFMQRMDMLLTKTPKDDIKNHVLPLVYRALEAPSPQIQELCLTILPTFAGMIDQASMKHSIIPRIKKLCLETDRLSTRVGSLVCTGKLMDHMDKWFVIDEVLPMVMAIPSREPAVLMGILGIIKLAIGHKKLGVTKELSATKLLPFLFPLCIENNLNLNQFNAFMSVIKELIRHVENEQRVKLEQLNSMQEEQKTSVDFNQRLQSQIKSDENPFAAMGIGNGTGQAGSVMDDMFKSFGLSEYLGDGTNKVEAVNRGTSSGSSKPDQTGSSTLQTSGSAAKYKQPAQVSLTMEEKQRIQNEQEFQQRAKKQQPLTALEKTKPEPKPQAKDMSRMLLDSSLNSKPNYKLSGATNSTMGGLGSNPAATSFGISNSMGGQTWNMNSSIGGTAMQTRQSTLGGGAVGTGLGGMPNNQSASRQKPNMAALDNLLGPSQKPKQTLSQMAPRSTPATQGMMGSRGMMGNQSMMGTHQGFMGNQGMMGTNQGFVVSNQGMMGRHSQGMMGSTQSTMGTQQQGMMGGFDPLAGSKQMNPQPKKSDDLLGFLG